MNDEVKVVSLFAIAEELKLSYEVPVIFVTMKDFADVVFDTLVQLRAEQLRHAAPDCIISVIHDFHQAWLRIIEDAEHFKCRIKATPRSTITNKAIEYTIQCGDNRVKYFQRYVDNLKETLTEDEKKALESGIKLLQVMNANLKTALLEKQTCLTNVSDNSEFYYKVVDETEELLNWVDDLSDTVANQFSKIVGIRLQQMLDLRATLKEIIDEVADTSNKDIQHIVQDIKCHSETTLSTFPFNSNSLTNLSDLIQKLQVLEERIDLLRRENSMAVGAIENKAKFLRAKFEKLEILRGSLLTCYSNPNFQKSPWGSDTHIGKLHMFNHALGAQGRNRLVKELMTLWSEAILKRQEQNSIISILSVADMKETYCDELGKFIVDMHGRKLYQSDGNKNRLYQLNDQNKLVPVTDDKEHVYFYDDCGRYYISKERYRVYKAHENASEYILNVHGLLLKTKEIRNGVTYYYDRLGRYYLDEEGQKVYIGRDGKKYEPDGTGNLVLKRELNEMHYCRLKQPIVVEETRYLQETVGEALKKCIADVICHQPNDPILYLAQCLERYRHHQLDMERKREGLASLAVDRDLRRQQLLSHREPTIMAVEASISSRSSREENY